MGRASHLQAALDDTDPVLDGRLTKVAFEPPQSRRWPFLMSFWSTLSLLRSTWQRFAAHSPQIVFLTGEPAHMLAAKVFKRMAPGFHCHLVLHGDVNTIQLPRSRNPLRRVGDYSGAISALNHPDVRLIALETHIAARLSDLLPAARQHVDVVRHPCAPSDVDWRAHAPAADRLRFGLLGIAGKSKGLDVFARLALRVARDTPLQADFRLIGKLQRNCEDLDLSGISGPLPFSHEWLPRETFDAEIAQLQYVVLPYNMEYYGLSASGVLLDVLRWRKPIVSLNTPVVKELAQRFGDIGYLCENEDEMLAAIDALCRGVDPERYQRQCANLDRAYHSRLPTATAVEYRAIQSRWLDAAAQPA